MQRPYFFTTENRLLGDKSKNFWQMFIKWSSEQYTQNFLFSRVEKDRTPFLGLERISGPSLEPLPPGSKF